jgi:hypothetical protein
MGESVKAREVIDRTTAQLVETGVRPDRAREIARDSMIRIDIREQGGKPPPRRPDAGNTPRR